MSLRGLGGVTSHSLLPLCKEFESVRPVFIGVSVEEKGPSDRRNVTSLEGVRWCDPRSVDG